MMRCNDLLNYLRTYLFTTYKIFKFYQDFRYVRVIELAEYSTIAFKNKL